MKIPILKNTFTNYLNMFVRLLQGILVTRWMIAELGEINYGLWTMLWSFFCYSLLLDFGLGVAAQKATATQLWKYDIRKYNATISTVILIHLVMSLLVVTGTVILSFFVKELFHLTEENLIRYCQRCFLLFGIGSAVVFPFGVFPEILVGLQKIYLRNNIFMIFKVVELVVVGILLFNGGKLLSLIVFTLILMIATQLAMAFSVFHSIPAFRLKLCWSRGVFLEIFHFSWTVYISSLARLIWERCSVLFISIFCGLVPVSIYQVGVRLTVLMSQLTGPYQENISPLAALLHARRKRKPLADILLKSMRWNSFLTTGMTIGILIYSPVLLRVLFHYEENLVEATLICRVTILSVWFWLVFRSIPEKYLLMAERHRFLAMAAVVEAVLFVLSSLVAFHYVQSLFVIVWTSILSRLISTCGFILPGLLQNTGMRLSRLVNQAFLRPALAALPMTVVACLEYRFLCGKIGDLLLLVIAGISGGMLYLLCSCVLVFDADDRRKYENYLKNRIWSFSKAK